MVLRVDNVTDCCFGFSFKIGKLSRFLDMNWAMQVKTNIHDNHELLNQ